MPIALFPIASPAFAQPGAKQIPKLCDQSIAQARSRIEKLKALPLNKVRPRTVLHAWNVLDMGLQDLCGSIGLRSETSAGPGVARAPIK